MAGTAAHRDGPLDAISDVRLAKLLARGAARGDRSSFERIYRRYHQELYRYCLAILRDPADAEDALQATMAAALRALPGEQRQIDLRPWLYRVAHNEAVSLLRERGAGAEPSEIDDANGDAESSAASEVEGRERLRSLVSDLKALPDRQRSALVMRELSGLSYGEIATAQLSSEAAAKQCVYEARVALRELEQGREMECELVRVAISERDGRRLRGRSMRAHLRSCEGCRDFRDAIFERREALQALCPPLPAVAASGLLAGLIGAGGGGGGAGAAVAGTASGAASVAGGGVAGSIAVKGASAVAALVIAAGAADVTGVVELPKPFGAGGSGSAQQASPAAGGQADDAAAAGAPSVGAADRAARARSTSAPAAERPDRGRDDQSRAAAPGRSPSAPGRQASGSPGNSGATPAQSVGQPAASPGNSGAPPRATPADPGTAPAQPAQPVLPPQANGSPAAGSKPESPGASSSAPGKSGTLTLPPKAQGKPPTP